MLLRRIEGVDDAPVRKIHQLLIGNNSGHLPKPGSACKSEGIE